ncbi:MAG: DUF542 domain-containing protein [Chloroflexi bacterium]|nr:DUF542 domain-containing protein [Chloroflexota bacterium]
MVNTIDINPDMTVDETLRKYPKAQTVFVRYGVDTCCGGFRKIRDGARIAGVELEKLLTELTTAAS